MEDKTPAQFFAERYGHGPESATIDEKAVEWNRLKDVAELRGFKPGWVAYRYKDLFGEWPPKKGYSETAEAPEVADKQAALADDFGPPSATKPPMQDDFDFGPPPMGGREVMCPHCGREL